MTGVQTCALPISVRAAVQYLMDEGIWAEILATWGVEDAALSTAVLNPTVKD